MPMYQFEAMDRTGQEIRDVIEALNEEEAQNTIRQMGYFVTKLSLKKGAQAAVGGKKKQKRGFVIGGGQDEAHMPVHTSVIDSSGCRFADFAIAEDLEQNQKPGRLKFTLQDVCEDIETGMTLSEAMARAPKVFSRLYVNMIKAGEAGGALETILQRLAQFLESAESLKRKVKGAMIYPVAVVLVAILILAGIMYFIVPTFKKMFEEFELKLPAPTVLLLAMSDYVVKYFWLMILLPIFCWLVGKLIRKFKHGRVGYDMFIIKVPIFGSLIERNILARTTRTLGTLISSGVPILEALNITRETAGNAMFERIFNKVIEAIREGDVIAKPMKENSVPGFHPMALFYWAWTGAFPGIMMMSVAVTSAQGVAKGKQAKGSASGSDIMLISGLAIGLGVIGMSLWYLLKMRTRVIDDLVVNMIDVGEETGELDTMLYKVADNYDEEVRVMTEGLTKLIEPMLIVFLGVAVGFIVVSLFMPLIELITSLSGGGKK